jgi:hypothetical protein
MYCKQQNKLLGSRSNSHTMYLTHERFKLKATNEVTRYTSTLHEATLKIMTVMFIRRHTMTVCALISATDHILSQPNPVDTLTAHIFKIHHHLSSVSQ